MTEDVGTGFHRKRQSAEPAEMLANAHRELWPIHEEATLRFFDRLPLYDPGFLARLCLGCPMQAPSLETCTRCGALIWQRDMAVQEAQRVLFIHGGGEIQPVVLLHDGSVAPVDDQLGSGFQQALSQGLHWADAVEPSPVTGKGATLPTAIGLSNNGAQIVDSLYVQGRRLLGSSDLRRIGGGDDVPTGQMALRSANQPPARQDFHSVYSRASGELFRLGGTDSATGQPAADIWVADVRQQTWRQVPLQGEMGPVVAATYSFADRRLWVIDETQRGNARFARLSRIVPGTGERDVVGEWPRPRLFDRHWLVIDRDGSIVLAASSTKLARHVLVRIRIQQDEPQVDLVRFGRHPLAFSPSVDDAGYSLPLQVSKTKLPETLRLERLDGKPGRWWDVGQCL